MNRKLRICATLALLAASSLTGAAQQTAPDELRAGFANPPAAARPRVWWHWMNGNVTKEGIKLDLEWMQRTGIGGFQNFDAALFTPQIVEHRLAFMTPEWQDAFHYAITLADQLGLEAAIAGSPGWSESGGPWVRPEQGMKKVVWSETSIEGGQPFVGVLAHPPTVSGPIQDSPLSDPMAPPGLTTPTYYADTTVLAFRQPEAELQPLMARARVSSSGGTIDAALLGDAHLDATVSLPIAPVGETAWIRFDFEQPETVRALTYVSTDHGFLEAFTGGAPGPELQASDDGEHWRAVVGVPGDGAIEHTLGFVPIAARHFRAVFETRPAPANALGDFDFGLLGMPAPKPATEYHIAELRLESGARVQRFEEKAGFGNLADLTAEPTPEATADAVIARTALIDLTGRMQADGRLEWTPPPGHWIVQRFGYSLTGIINHPASTEGTGLEVDKLDAAAVLDYMTHYLDLYRAATGGLMGRKGLQYLISDSWEAGTANWTPDLLAQFQRRRGYDATPWLPVLTGRVVDSSAASDRFLWDYRRTLADLVAENHYELITQLLHARGMGHYGESHENGRTFIGDGMEAKRSNDVPMSAMWTQFPGVNQDQPGSNADIRESASVAHLYGQNLVAAESLTAAAGAWRWSPATLKPTADKELAMGLNRFVIHTSVHQPLLDKAPGISLGPFGQWFTRNETWSGAGAKAWVDYLARSSYLLQQGQFVADIAWFYGEDSNITALYGKAAPPVPEGYNFDYLNADALRHQLKVVDGQLGTDSGMRYRVLALDARAVHMSLPVLRALGDLVAAGAVVCGARPVDSPSLADDAQAFQALVAQVWGERGAGPHQYGKGRVYEGRGLGEVLAAEGVAPDVQFTRPQADTELLAVHRRLADGDLYFVNNRQQRAESIDASFRITGRVPELWHADTGRIEAVAWHRGGDRTVVSLQLDPWDAVFVVFRKPVRTASAGLPAALRTQNLPALEGPWTVAFESGRGAPAQLQLAQLASWSSNPDPGVKYYAGTGTYTRTLDVPSNWLAAGAQVWLDLGEVHELAEVRVNGRALGVLWKAPYRLDLAPALHSGSNLLEIAVTDLWVNRLIGDAQPDAPRTYTFTVPRFYKPGDPLVPSGLLGPVRVTLSRPVLQRVAPRPAAQAIP